MKLLLLPTALAAACQPASDAEWGYAGTAGPQHWAELSPAYALCREGREQSPVDLARTDAVAGPRIERRIGSTVLSLEERASVMDLVDNGHTIQITNDAALSMDIGGEHFEFVQAHFHAPSEHTLDGKRFPLEAHFVHQSAAGRLAVAAILLEEGAHNAALDPIIGHLPSATGERRHLEDLELDMDAVQPLPERYFRYAGSLTTPPCTEGVKWVVAAQPRSLSAEQLAAFRSRLHHNSRPIQPLLGREIGFVASQ